MSEFIKIAILENEIEASLVESVLKDRNIPHFIRSYSDFAYNGIYQIHQGWGVILSKSEFQQQIKEIISDIRKS